MNPSEKSEPAKSAPIAHIARENGRKAGRKASQLAACAKKEAFGRRWAWLTEAIWKWADERCARTAAALAFYAIFSLAPTLVAAVAAASIFLGPQAATGELASKISLIVGNDAGRLIETTLASAWQSQQAKGASIWAIVAMLVGASAGFTSLTNALNEIWAVKAEKGVKASALTLARERALSFVVALAIGVGVVALIVAQAALGALSQWSPWALPGPLAQMGQSGALAVAIGFAFGVLLKVLPNCPVRWKDAFLGGFVAMALLMVGKGVFGLYLSHVGALSAFGAAGTLAALLLWLWFGANALLFGAQVARGCALRRENKPYRGLSDDLAGAAEIALPQPPEATAMPPANQETKPNEKI